MGPVPSETVCIYGARIISKHLDSLLCQIDGVKSAEDVEAIHQMRVASRRMRTALTIFASCFKKQEIKSVLKDVRDVTKELGEARDLDVHLLYLQEEAKNFSSARLNPGVRRLILRLNQQRQEAQTGVVKAMDQFVDDHIAGKIGKWAAPLLDQSRASYLFSPALYQLAFESINQRLDELEGRDLIVRDPAEVLELHAMRISAKRLRYTLEAFEDLYGDLIKPYLSKIKQIQETLGTVHDLDVWVEMIPAFIQEEELRITTYFGHAGPLKRLLPGLEAFRKAQEEKRKAEYSNFIQQWDAQTSDGVWLKLRQLISAPIDLETALRVSEMEKPSGVGMSLNLTDEEQANLPENH